MTDYGTRRHPHYTALYVKLIMPLPTDSDFPADDAIVDAFNGHEAERDYWAGHMRAIQTDNRDGDAAASERAREDAQHGMEGDVVRLSPGYLKAHSRDIVDVLAGD